MALTQRAFSEPLPAINLCPTCNTLRDIWLLCRTIGYTLQNVNNPGAAVIATCGGSECAKTDTKYLATVQDATGATGKPTDATHKLETGTVSKGLYKIQLWGINAITTAGTPSSPSANAVATYGEC